MKTSKIIFISLLSVIALLILSAGLDIRIDGRQRGDFRDRLKVNRQAVPSFKVLYLNNSKNVELVQNDSSFIVVTSMKDSITPKINYSIKEDTMRLTDFDKRNQPGVWISIHVANTLENIQLKKSDINIVRFGSGRLSLNLDRSSVWMDQNKDEKYSLHILDIVAKNHSKFDTGNFKVDSLGIVLQNSKADIRVYAKKISGCMYDSSSIWTRQPEEISMKKDKTSKINVDDY